jgi:hypothetical protein
MFRKSNHHFAQAGGFVKMNFAKSLFFLRLLNFACNQQRLTNPGGVSGFFVGEFCGGTACRKQDGKAGDQCP